MVHKRLSTYFTPNLVQLGRAHHGGSIFPPNMEVETDATVRCPADRREFITTAVCRLSTQTQFEQDQLVFHGTADPYSPVFPTEEQDNLRCTPSHRTCPSTL